MNSILYEVKRGGFTEIKIHGFVSVHDGEKVIYQSSDWDPSFPARSLLKPIQFLATGEYNSKEPKEKLASGMGSLSALPSQVDKLKIWYGEDQIRKVKAPPSYPMDEISRVLLKQKGQPPSVFYQPCLGKHLSILEACRKNGWDEAEYLSEVHPYHFKLLEMLKDLLNVRKQVSFVKDGCLLPSPVLKLSELAHLYQKIAEGQGDFEKIRGLMTGYPEWIGGVSRFDTRIMQENAGKVIAKEGADGLLGIGILPTEEFPRGLGVVAKVDSGYEPNAMMLSLSPILERVGLKPVHFLPKGQEVQFHYLPFQKKQTVWKDVSPLINEKLAVWPGDVKFQRVPSMETAKGAHMTLSSIQTTVHLGTHTDGLNHFEAKGTGIEAAEVAKYIGAVQVIEVKKPRGTVILPEDIEGVFLKAERVLFKTNSYPNVKEFNEDFVALSKELVAFLASKNVRLIGIDTPSIDPFPSKDLPAHHETTRWNVGILEGVVLEGVTPGMYFMSAVPLKIENADASPVRVVLTSL